MKSLRPPLSESLLVATVSIGDRKAALKTAVHNNKSVNSEKSWPISFCFAADIWVEHGNEPDVTDSRIREESTDGTGDDVTISLPDTDLYLPSPFCNESYFQGFVVDFV